MEIELEHGRVTDLSTTAEGGYGCGKAALASMSEMPRDEREALITRAGGVQGIATMLRVDPATGLAHADVWGIQQRCTVFGENKLPPAKIKSLLKHMLEAASDKVIILLIVAACVSIGLGMGFEDVESGWIEGTAIIIAVIVVIMVTALNNWSKERKFQALNAVKDNVIVTVMRDRAFRQMSQFDVVVGDAYKIGVGDKLIADGILVDGFDLRMNESSATGESESLTKSSRTDRFFLSGTSVEEGEGIILVVAVGVNSFHGRATMALRESQEDHPATPLQNTLEILAGQIGQAGMAIAGLLLAVLICQYFIGVAIRGEYFEGSKVAQAIVHYLITSVAIIVVAVPEGLPLAVTIALAYSMMKMMKDNNLVRVLSACETMGGATTICSDKTGTLTQNKMTVVRGWICERNLTSFKAIHDFVATCNPKVTSVVAEAICSNSSSEEQTDAEGRLKWVGSQTEVALLQFVGSLNVDYREVRDKCAVERRWPFSSDKKRMSTAIVRGPGEYRVHVKGASEIVHSLCTKTVRPDGTVADLTDEDRSEITMFIQSMAREALRTVCLAYQDVAVEKGSVARDVLEEPVGDMVIIGIFGIMDPLREETAGAVQDCQRAGIIVRMVTGDNLETARNIARHCYILARDMPHATMEGPVFRNLTREARLAAVRDLRVLARSSPVDKQLLVEALQELGEVVAVTGDGTNDAPALAKADVGFAMNTGTDVAKEASSIILMDDNFASIVKAVLWGRNVMDSIRKFLQLQITINVVAVTVACIGAISSGGSSPLTAVQLLWVNLVMDAFAALALATDSPTPDMLNRKPYGKKPLLITRNMWKHIGGIASYQLIVILVVLYAGDKVFAFEEVILDSRHHYSLVFNLFVCLQLGNEFNCRRIYDEKNVFQRLTSNWLFIIIMIGTFGVQILLVTFGGDFTDTVPLDITEWAICVGLGLTCLPLSQLLRCLPTIKDPAPEYLKSRVQDLNGSYEIFGDAQSPTKAPLDESSSLLPKPSNNGRPRRLA